MKRFLLLTIFSFWPLTSQAYNFLYIHPTTGRPIGWAPGTTIHYYVDPGPLGRLTNEQARILLAEAMKIWENASPNANVPHFEYAGLLPEDVNGTNYSQYVSLGGCYQSDLDSCPSQAQKDLKTVIVFDQDGSILKKELCRIGGCSASSGARVFSGTSSNPGNIVQGIAVFGKVNFVDSFSLGSDIYFTLGLMTHELGHLLGLAHTVVNQEIYINNLWNTDKSYVPTMLSFIFPESRGLGEKDQMTLSPDDIAGITTLYPSSTASANTGTIKGMITKSDGTPMMHVNVIARNNDDPLCEAVSFLSGRLCQRPFGTVSSSQCHNIDGNIVEDGSYNISGLPVGTYTLEVEEVAVEKLAFTLAPGLLDEFIYGDAEFWNVGDTASESNLDKSFITLAAGEIKENINIVLNRSSVTSDRVKYLPLSTFTPGPGTRCQPASKNYATLVGVSEPSGRDTTGGNVVEGGTTSLAGGCSLLNELHKQNM